MIDKTQAIPIVEKKLFALPPGHCLEIRTYKRDRSVLFVKKTMDRVLVFEDGYERQEFEIGLKGLRKLLKTLLKRKFPRSTKIRVYSLGPYDSRTSGSMKRKKI